jgi:hypothetical protein
VSALHSVQHCQVSECEDATTCGLTNINVQSSGSLLRPTGARRSFIAEAGKCAAKAAVVVGMSGCICRVEFE